MNFPIPKPKRQSLKWKIPSNSPPRPRKKTRSESLITNIRGSIGAEKKEHLLVSTTRRIKFCHHYRYQRFLLSRYASVAAKAALACAAETVNSSVPI